MRDQTTTLRPVAKLVRGMPASDGDGVKLTRVRLDQVLAIASAGNYVEFVLMDGRRLPMRSPLSALENELGPRGFLRTHRSWLVNAVEMTALKPDGSGDYTVRVWDSLAPAVRSGRSDARRPE